MHKTYIITPADGVMTHQKQQK